MWLYNFGVHGTVDETATMMVWAENEGKRGSCEVASCLQRIFDVRRSGAKHLILWSDAWVCWPEQEPYYGIYGF